MSIGAFLAGAAGGAGDIAKKHINEEFEINKENRMMEKETSLINMRAEVELNKTKALEAYRANLGIDTAKRTAIEVDPLKIASEVASVEALSGPKARAAGENARAVNDNTTKVYGEGSVVEKPGGIITKVGKTAAPETESDARYSTARADEAEMKVGEAKKLTGLRAEMDSALASGDVAKAKTASDRIMALTGGTKDVPASKVALAKSYFDEAKIKETNGDGPGALEALKKGREIISGTDPAAAPAPYKDGKELIGEDGARYVVSNGIPILKSSLNKKPSEKKEPAKEQPVAKKEPSTDDLTRNSIVAELAKLNNKKNPTPQDLDNIKTLSRSLTQHVNK